VEMGDDIAEQAEMAWVRLGYPRRALDEAHEKRLTDACYGIGGPRWDQERPKDE
jgi:hypothetical protein